ncbi:3'(2'),5'-bisphosphate nucleotidase 1 [Seminavis robusta]|uniref:3'(2'),5'-bisphosphate nucleotidase 1 n=1 Tax=Seminavis robusta TaxID=568900 RepID=A0A9N8H163_9STRA|nr:3'(2'),5'-bisphosphate nucleotidase 1 [Seminavis robusta]|eukprot:Sro11_g008910.1 3'(2'),5'-bisphosphate nucleotidase 1 (378) ;mRNA; r:196227-197360
MASGPSVNLLDMASSVMSAAVGASLTIRAFALPEDSNKNARLKVDGTFVTDADYAAQQIITSAVQRVSTNVRILGEESPEGGAKIPQEKLEHASDAGMREGCRREVFLRFKNRSGGSQAPQSLPLAVSSHDATIENKPSYDLSEDEKKEVIVDVSRVCVIIDPLDGTSSYAKGKYDAVSVLVSVNLDYQPHFGVICKPFGYEGLPPVMGTPCAAVYGGPLLGGGFIAGGDTLLPVSAATQPTNSENPSSDLPRAIISSSRSKGVVEDVCKQLGMLGVIDPTPMHISGAGEKALRLVLRQHNEGLWFFPKSGTSLWDVAAADAMLRSLGGKVTDKFGRPLDYSKSRDEAENEDGVIACADDKLHAECMRVFQNGKWEE